MKEDLRLNEIRDLLLEANKINDYGIRCEMQKCIWGTLMFYIKGSYKKISGEEKLAREILNYDQNGYSEYIDRTHGQTNYEECKGCKWSSFCNRMGMTPDKCDNGNIRIEANVPDNE